METITIKQALLAHMELANMKLSKFDKEVRNIAIVNYATLAKIHQEQQKFQEDMKEKMFDKKKEEISELSQLRAKLQAAKTREEAADINKQLVCDYAELIQLEDDFNKLVNAETKKDISADIKKVDMDKFIDSMIKAEIDFTPVTINNLQFMFN